MKIIKKFNIQFMLLVFIAILLSLLVYENRYEASAVVTQNLLLILRHNKFTNEVELCNRVVSREAKIDGIDCSTSWDSRHVWFGK